MMHCVSVLPVKMPSSLRSAVKEKEIHKIKIYTDKYIKIYDEILKDFLGFRKFRKQEFTGGKS